MKKILFILSVMISTTVFSRTPEEIKVRDVRMEKQGENLTVNFKLDVPQHAVKSKYKQFLVPIVYNQEQTIPLPSIEVIGRNKAKRERQERWLAGNREYLPDDLIAAEGETLSYSASIPYAEWMDTLSLRLERLEEGCCTTKALASLQLMEGVGLVPKQQAVPVVAEPVDSVEKTVTVRHFTVYFRLNQATIDMGWEDNARTLREVADFLKQNAKVKVEIAGFASPEGSETWNEQLANRRAEALKRYLTDQGGMKPEFVTIVSHSIDWEGLKSFVSGSDLPYKTEVLKILNDTSQPELTNRKLQQLQGGVPYRYLLTKVYPKLRVASFSITNF